MSVQIISSPGCPGVLHPLGTISSQLGVQQGYPLGPLLVHLVLGVHVRTIAEDSALQ